MKNTAEMLDNTGTYTTVVLAILMDKYGTEFMEWDPAVLAQQIVLDFAIDEVTADLNDKIQAGISIFTSTAFYNSIEIFSSICNTLSFNVGYSTDIFIPADIDDCMWGCIEVKLLEGDEYNKQDFTPDIATFVGMLLSNEGIYKPPSALSFAIFPDEESVEDVIADDPIFFQSFWKGQEDKKAGLEILAQKRLRDLFTQLDEVDVGDIDKGFTSKVRDSLGRDAG